MLFLIVNLKFLKVTETELQCFYWADILSPLTDYYVNDLKLDSFNRFTDNELRRLHGNHNGSTSASANWDRETLLGAVLNIAHSLPVDKTDVGSLEGLLGGPPLEPVGRGVQHGTVQLGVKATSTITASKPTLVASWLS